MKHVSHVTVLLLLIAPLAMEEWTISQEVMSVDAQFLANTTKIIVASRVTLLALAAMDQQKIIAHPALLHLL
jgi:hypothetical protein